MNLLNKSRGLITGITNKYSIAWGIAKLAKEHGADLAITYYDDPKLKDRVSLLAEELNIKRLYPCDLTNEASIKNLVKLISNEWEGVDFVLHSIAFTDKQELQGRYIDVSLDNFLQTMHTSCYSLVSLLKNLESLMSEGASVLALTYHGSSKVIPNYHVMGVAKAALESSVRYLAFDLGKKNIRVNALSAGPIKTLSSSAIGDLRDMLKVHKINPFNRNITQLDIARSAIYFISDLSSGVTGEVHYVDCGYNIIGCMPIVLKT